MTKIESKKVVVASPAANVHDFLINTDNIQQLLPEGKITEWKSDGKQCSFKIQGAYTIGLRLINSTPNTSVVLTGTPSSGYSFTWSPTTGMSNSTLAQTNALIEETTTYTYTLSDPFCSKSDTVQVKVLEYICGDEFVYIPNAFSPNGDGDNDILYVRSKLIDQMIFRIFDRWGELVFESTSRADGWDGTFKGKPCDPDVYDYYLKGTCIGGEETLIKGNITLLK
jgi:gliding motility-associated-like protein